MLRILLATALCVVVALAPPARAQAPAAFADARKAYEAEQFDKARDLLLSAARTAPKNAEVFLLLGKAHYQLGELGEAVTAWQRTLRLAPREPYAVKMLQRLRSEVRDVDVQIKLVEQALAEGLNDWARVTTTNLLGKKSLTDAQRGQLTVLATEAELALGRYKDVPPAVLKIRTQFPKAADAARLALLMGRAKIHLDDKSILAGRKILQGIVADHKDTPEAAIAQYELIRFDLGQSVTAGSVGALAAWIKANADHPLADEALQGLVDSQFALTLQGPRPSKDSPLAPTDVAAIGSVQLLRARLPKAADRLKLTQQVDKHLQTQYDSAGAYPAAIQGGLALLKLDLSRAERAMVLERIVDRHLASVRNTPTPARDAKLAAAETAALARAKELLPLLTTDANRQKLAKTLLNHFASRYVKAGAYAAAIQGTQAVLALPIAPSDRLAAMKTLAAHQTALAMRSLTEQAASATLPARMPKAIQDILALYATIRRESPVQSTSVEEIKLANSVLALAAKLPKPAEVTALSAPDAWAVEIALEVLRRNAKTGAPTAIALVDTIRKRYVAVKAPGGLRIALGLSRRVLAALSDNDGLWAPTRLERVRVLGLLATWQLHENVRVGADNLNAKLSDRQKEMIALLAELVKRDVRAQAAGAVATLAKHLEPWQVRGHYATAEAAYALLADSLPPARQREVKLAVAELWIRQATAEHQRLVGAGLKVPVALDPALAKALKRCYELQGGLDEADVFGAKVRKVVRRVVDHYRGLEYYDTATAAIRAKSEPAVPVADRYAQLALADDLYARAQRELARLLRTYRAQTQIAMTPAFQAALKAYQTFLSQHATSRLAGTAVASVFSIAQTFESNGAHTVAAGVYDEFAKFAAKVPTLSQAAPGQASTAERAAMARVSALDAHARKALAKALAKRTDKTPPAKILPEFTAAIAACKQFVADRPKSVGVGPAIRKIMAIALAYAQVDAWDVAEGIFADLAGSNLKLDDLDRIELSRGLCHLGKVMGDHARGVLTALVQGHGRPKRSGGQSRLAQAPAEKPVKPAGRKPANTPGPGTPKPVIAPATAGKIAARDVGTTFEEKNEDLARDEADVLAMAAIRKQQSLRARQVAMLREKVTYASPVEKKDAKARKQPVLPPILPVLSEAELARQDKAFDAARTIFQAVRKNFPLRPSAKQARGEVLVMADHWRGIAHWKRAADLMARYLKDNPTDHELPKLRLGVARDVLAWASKPMAAEATKQARLAEVTRRFAQARTELERIVKDFAEDRPFIQQAQWDIAGSFLTQARVVANFSPTLARGQYVRAARELRAVAETFHDHPRISTIPQMLWSIAEELARRAYYDEAMIVWSDLTIHYLAHPLAKQAALRIAQTFESNLRRPLRAAETYVEINFARGGNDASAQTAIYNIGMRLKGQKRWVEALHVLETFVDSFPRHPQAGQALTTIGQIHQTNEAWEDAIVAYLRVIDEFPSGNWVRDAKWSIAECRINLSQWRKAQNAYGTYVAANAKDPRVAEAKRRMGVAKDLARYQVLVDEKGQRKAFDAQYQIGRIVQEQLANPTKAIIEYRKVAARWPKTHLADDALFEVGKIHLSMNETARGREALLELARTYPESPLADDALYRVGQSYEAEAQQLAGVTRGKAVEKNKEIAQRDAYRQVQEGRRRMRFDNDALVSALRKKGQKAQADVAQARFAGQQMQFNLANTIVAAQAAERQVEALTATQLADRQDKINAALRQAITSYQQAAKVATADKADEALLQMARIYDQKLKDADAAMATWQEIVRQFSGTAVAEDASWRIAEFHDRKGQYAQAIQAYQAFLRNYRRSTRAAAAQFAVAEAYEHLGEWVKAMDAYTNYINNFPKAPMVAKAKQQISWIKTYRL